MKRIEIVTAIMAGVTSADKNKFGTAEDEELVEWAGGLADIIMADDKAHK